MFVLINLTEKNEFFFNYLALCEPCVKINRKVRKVFRKVRKALPVYIKFEWC